MYSHLFWKDVIKKKNVSMWWATVANDVVYGGVVFVACNTFNPAVSVCSLVYIRNSDERCRCFEQTLASEFIIITCYIQMMY